MSKHTVRRTATKSVGAEPALERTRAHKCSGGEGVGGDEKRDAKRRRRQKDLTAARKAQTSLPPSRRFRCASRDIIAM